MNMLVTIAQKFRVLHHQRRPRRHPMQHKSTQDQCHHDVVRQTEGQKRDETAAGRGVGRGFRRRNTSDGACAEILVLLAPTLCYRVRDVGGDGRPAAGRSPTKSRPGCLAQSRAARRASPAGSAAPPTILSAAGCERLPVIFDSSKMNTSEIPNRPMTMGTRSMPVWRLKVPNVKRAELRTGSRPTVPSNNPSKVTATAFPIESGRQIADERQPQQRKRKIFRRPEVEGEFRQRRRDKPEAQQTEHSGDECAEHRHAECSSGPALFGQLVAVDRNHDGCGFTGHAEKDGGDRAAIHGTVPDSGQHDHRGCRVEKIGDGQQQSNRCGRPQAGKNADDNAESDADQT